MQCLMDHIVINAEDDERLIEFYSNVLMLATERLDEYRAGDAPFPSIRLNPDTIIDLFPKKLWHRQDQAPRGVHNMNHLCLAFSKEAWLKLSKRLEDNKVQIEDGPGSRWGARGNGISIYFRDPENNLIEARYYEGA